MEGGRKGESPIGYPATLANVSRADLVQFHAQHYHASNMRLVVLGRESLAQLTTMVEAENYVTNYVTTMVEAQFSAGLLECQTARV